MNNTPYKMNMKDLKLYMLRKRINKVRQYIAERENEICEPFSDKEFKQSMKFYKNKKAKPYKHTTRGVWSHYDHSKPSYAGPRMYNN